MRCAIVLAACAMMGAAISAAAAHSSLSSISRLSNSTTDSSSSRPADSASLAAVAAADDSSLEQLTLPWACGYTAPDGSTFDFSGLTTATGTSFKGTADDVYSANVCGIAQGDGAAGTCVKNSATVCMQYNWFCDTQRRAQRVSAGGCSGAMMRLIPACCRSVDAPLCVDSLRRSPNWFAIAENQMTPVTAPPAWSLVDPTNSKNGVQMIFNNGMYGPNSVTLRFVFMCTTATGDPAWTTSHDNSFHWIVTVTSSLCCPVGSQDNGGGSPSKGLSGGWVFIIMSAQIS